MNPWRKHRRQKLRRQWTRIAGHVAQFGYCLEVGETTPEQRRMRSSPTMTLFTPRLLQIETATGYMLDALMKIPNTLPEFDRITNDDGTVESDDDYIRRVRRLRQRKLPVD